MKFSMILAIDSKNGLGRENTLAWRLSRDMLYFKNITLEKVQEDKINAVIMGRKTWMSIPKKFRPLSGRLNCVLTRNSVFQDDDAMFFDSFDGCLSELEKTKNIENIFLIGGGTLYNSFVYDDRLEKIYLTRIQGDFDCDVFFDGIPNNFYKISSSQPVEESGIIYVFEVWGRKTDKNTPK